MAGYFIIITAGIYARIMYMRVFICLAREKRTVSSQNGVRINNINVIVFEQLRHAIDISIVEFIMAAIVVVVLAVAVGCSV